MSVTLEDIRRAADATVGHIARTPFLHSATLSRLAGCELYIKFENHQFTAAFKERGALNKLARLSDEERRQALSQPLPATMRRGSPIMAAGSAFR